MNCAFDIYEKIKNDILLNHIHPGDRLSENEVAVLFQVSRTPVRQAFQKLEQKGLVHIIDGVGTFVTTFSVDDMVSAYQLRNAVEKLALTTSISNIEPDELDNLKERFSKFCVQFSKGGYGVAFEQITFADWELHDLIVSRSNNTLLFEAVEKASFLTRRYQFTYVSSFERANKEHLELIDDIREGNLDRAIQLLDKHLQYRTAE